MNGVVATLLLGQGPRTREGRSPGEGDGSSPPPLGGGGQPPSKQQGRGQGARAQARLTLKARAISDFNFELPDSLFLNINYWF